MSTDDQYHITKRDRFRAVAEHLYNNPLNAPADSSCDANVQDYFYAMIHEAERYLWVGFGFDSRGHGTREARMNNWVIVRNNNPRNRMMRALRYHQNQARHGEHRLVFDNFSHFCYFTLNALREDVVYGETHLGPLRHANRRDVEWARRLFIDFIRSLTRHEGNLRGDNFL